MRVLATGTLIGYALVVIVGLVFRNSASIGDILGDAVLFAAALLAAIACLAAWRAISAPATGMWLLFGLAAGLAALSEVGNSLHAFESRSIVVHLLWLGSYAALLGALVYAVHASEHGRVTELALDVSLILTAALLVVVRWAPGAHMAITASSALNVALVVWAPVAALSAMLLGAVLITSPQKILPLPSMIGIAAAIVCFAIAVVPQIIDGGACCRGAVWPALAGIGIWAFVAFAGLAGLAAGELPSTILPRERLRQFVAPTVAIVLALISVEAAVNPPLGGRSAVALGILGALVAIRLTELLNATRLQVVERRELAQSRALVEVSRALAGKNDLDTTLNTVTQWAVRVLNARAAAVELLSDDGKTLVLRAAEGLPEYAIGMKFDVQSSFTGRVVINGQPRVTTNPRRDPFIGPDSLKLLGDSPVAAVPLRYRERLLGVLSCIGNRPFHATDLELLRAFANQTALALEDARLFEQVRALSITDPLTGLANRRQMDRELLREFAAAQRGRRLVAVMFDIDEFKQLNDTYGHVTGDEIIKRFADALALTTRTMNLAARYGGDEFFALLADAELAGTDVFVTRVKERFRRSLEAARLPLAHASAGIAEFTPEMKKPEDLVEAADRALYIAKLEADVNA